MNPSPPPTAAARPAEFSPTFVLVGNPNTGKSTLFNALTGQRQQVANYPGVTVARKSGQFVWESTTWEVTDLPGTYSLAAQSPDERITAEVLAGQVAGVPFSAIVCVVDASNLRRNLFLATQVIELGYPTVIALSKVDLLQSRGQSLDDSQLAAVLHCPIVRIDARREQGLVELKQTLAGLIAEPTADERRAELRRRLTGAASDSPSSVAAVTEATNARYAWIDRLALPAVQGRPSRDAESTSGGLADAGPRTSARGTASAADPLPSAASLAGVSSQSFSDRIDTCLTHWLTGGLFFLLIMFGMFFAVFQIADPASQWIDWGRELLDESIVTWMPEGMFRDMVSEGLVGGVGNFLVFLPQIFVLFLFIGILESSGYMARAAYLMDRAFSPVGLSGKSFVPLLSSFACAVPGIMATRIIESRRDRLLTMMVAPLMSCSARLPVYVLMTSALVSSQPWLQSLILLGMYLIGVVVALAVVLIWKRLVWREPSPAFLMELPEFQFPDWFYVFRQTVERAGEFVVRAGTVILAVTVLVWAANYFPRNDQIVASQLSEMTRLEAEAAADDPELAEADAEDEARASRLSSLALEVAAIRQENSYLGRAGKWIEPIVKPLGWDWRIGCAAIASFPAREVIVTTLGILYQVDEPEEGSPELHQALRQATWPDTGQPVFTVPVALSIMVFFALCSQCASTLAVIYQETQSWFYPSLSFVYMTVLAYVGALVTYQLGSWIGL